MWRDNAAGLMSTLIIQEQIAKQLTERYKTALGEK
jgi:hypothetical protein